MLTNKRAIDRTLKRLKKDVTAIPGIEFLPEESQTIGGRGRMDTFGYRSHFEQVEGFPSTVRLEPGIQSGDHPTAAVQISSIVGKLLTERGVADGLGIEGLKPFSMTLLHFRRTFVEKLFAIHGKVERLKQDGSPLGRDVRHYADLYVLAGRPEVTTMLDSAEYGEIKADYHEKSQEFFSNSYRPPPDLRFDNSGALFPSDKVRAMIEPDYEEECRRLFFKPHPPFARALERFEKIRERL